MPESTPTRTLAILLVTLLLTSCSGTTLSGSWRSPDHQQAVRKIYIVGISRQETHRRIFEDEFGRELERYGVRSASSYKDLRGTRETPLEVILEKAKGTGADALLMTRLLSRRTEKVVNPGRISGYSYDPYAYRAGYYPRPYYRNYRDYYDRRFEMTYEPATITRFQVITLESNLYDAATGELIWSAQLDTVMDGTIEAMIRGFIEVVTGDLLKQGVI